MLDVDEPLSVGADRIVNVLAASRLYPGDLIVVDFGTATTFDCVTSDARFIGGVIMPGAPYRGGPAHAPRRQAARDGAACAASARSAGARRTAFRPACCSARRTRSTASSAGSAPNGPAAARREVIATGGLAGLVAPLVRAIERVDPDLTLHGLRFAAEHLGLAW